MRWQAYPPDWVLVDFLSIADLYDGFMRIAAYDSWRVPAFHFDEEYA